MSHSVVDSMSDTLDTCNSGSTIGDNGPTPNVALSSNLGKTTVDMSSARVIMSDGDGSP